MTEKQAQKNRDKIKKIKAALAADKKRRGGFYDDSRGLRYLPPQLYVIIGDWVGGLRYLRWFQKNFADDIGLPVFLFEWAVILFKSGKIPEAEHKVFDVFCSNIYIIDVFFQKPLVMVDKWESSNLENPVYAQVLPYSHNQSELSDFAEWLVKFTRSERFISASQKFIEINKKLKTETGSGRRALINEEQLLKKEF